MCGHVVWGGDRAAEGDLRANACGRFPDNVDDEACDNAAIAAADVYAYATDLETSGCPRGVCRVSGHEEVYTDAR